MDDSSNDFYGYEISITRDIMYLPTIEILNEWSKYKTYIWFSFSDRFNIILVEFYRR